MGKVTDKGFKSSKGSRINKKTAREGGFYYFLKEKYFCPKNEITTVIIVTIILDGVGYIPHTSTKSFSPK